jgi:hypothetical protein
MDKTHFDAVVEQVKTLSGAEQWRLLDLLEAWLAPPQNVETEEEFERQLLKEGILDHVPPPITNPTPYQDREPVEHTGPPVSQRIIEERR